LLFIPSQSLSLSHLQHRHRFQVNLLHQVLVVVVAELVPMEEVLFQVNLRQVLVVVAELVPVEEVLFQVNLLHQALVVVVAELASMEEAVAVVSVLRMPSIEPNLLTLILRNLPFHHHLRDLPFRHHLFLNLENNRFHLIDLLLLRVYNSNQLLEMPPIQFRQLSSFLDE
jgi:hypothetical protein